MTTTSILKAIFHVQAWVSWSPQFSSSMYYRSWE